MTNATAGELDDFLMVQYEPETRRYPTRIELAGFYSQDAADFFKRYKLAFDSEVLDFQSIKSRRAKAYVDLRMAFEALLKSVVCLRSPRNLSGKPLVDSVVAYGHRIDRLRGAALRDINIADEYLEILLKCDSAPVGLRYNFDAMNFRVPDDGLYYETIGSDAWLKSLEDLFEVSMKRLSLALSRRSKIIPGKIALQERLNRPRDF